MSKKRKVDNYWFIGSDKSDKNKNAVRRNHPPRQRLPRACRANSPTSGAKLQSGKERYRTAGRVLSRRRRGRGLVSSTEADVRRQGALRQSKIAPHYKYAEASTGRIWIFFQMPQAPLILWIFTTITLSFPGRISSGLTLTINGSFQRTP